MKVLILSVFVLISVSYSSAQVNTPQSNRINYEAVFYINVLKNKAVNEKNIFRNEVVALANKLFNQLSATKTQLNIRFGTFGQLGKQQIPIWSGDIDTIISGVKQQLNQVAVESILVATLNNLRALILDPRNSELEALKAAVNVNPALVACWDNNDGSIKVITDKLVKEVQPLIDAQVVDLKAGMIQATSDIKGYGDVFNTYLLACKSVDFCGNKYIQENYAQLLLNIQAANKIGGDALRKSIGLIFAGARTLALASVEEYKSGPKAQIQACLAA